MNNNDIQTQLISTNGIGAAVDYNLLAGYPQQQLPRSLGIEPVEGGFIVSGYFAGTHRRCVAANVPALVKLLRAWSGQFKPKAES